MLFQKQVSTVAAAEVSDKTVQVLDFGCGDGRYLRQDVVSDIFFFNSPQQLSGSSCAVLRPRATVGDIENDLQKKTYIYIYTYTYRL